MDMSFERAFEVQAPASRAWEVLVEPLGPERCRVAFRATLDVPWWALPMGVLMPLLTRASVLRLGEEMKHQIEEGSLHPRKLRKAG